MSTTESQTATQANSQPTATPKLETRELTKVFKTRTGDEVIAVEKVNLELHANELVCLVGASGCGKSTLLNIMAGLLDPSEGEVRVDGHPVLGPGPDRGMVFQSYTLYPWMSVADNIGFGLRIRGLSAAEQKERVQHFLQVVKLEKFARAYPKELSGGMKQRVAIARALANEPEVVLMDEPFGALDAQTKAEMQLFLLQLWEQTHTTFFMITHDVEEAVFLSRRVYVMDTNPGRIGAMIDIDLPDKRDPEIKFDQSFLTEKRKVFEALTHSH